MVQIHSPRPDNRGAARKRHLFPFGVPDVFHVYVMRSEVTGRLYTGSTGDLDDRLRRHNTGECKATRHGVPWALVHAETLATRAQAVRRERYFKTGRGREELQTLLAANITPLNSLLD